MKDWRNFKLAFDKGLWFGLGNGFISEFTKGREPWTFKHNTSDSKITNPKSSYKEIKYPKKDDKYTFDLLSNLGRSGTNHDHDQPSHLKIKNGLHDSPTKSYDIFAGLEERFCPAKVYEFVDEKL